MIEAKRLRLFQGIEFGRRDVILILSSFLVFGIFMPPLYFETAGTPTWRSLVLVGPLPFS